MPPVALSADQDRRITDSHPRNPKNPRNPWLKKAVDCVQAPDVRHRPSAIRVIRVISSNPL